MSDFKVLPGCSGAVLMSGEYAFMILDDDEFVCPCDLIRQNENETYVSCAMRAVLEQTGIMLYPKQMRRFVTSISPDNEGMRLYVVELDRYYQFTRTLVPVSLTDLRKLNIKMIRQASELGLLQ